MGYGSWGVEEPRPAVHRVGQQPDEAVEGQDVGSGRVHVQVARLAAGVTAIRATSSTCTGWSRYSPFPRDREQREAAKDPAQVVDQDVARTEGQGGRTMAWDIPEARMTSSSRALAARYFVGASVPAFTTLTWTIRRTPAWVAAVSSFCVRPMIWSKVRPPRSKRIQYVL